MRRVRRFIEWGVSTNLAQFGPATIRTNQQKSPLAHFRVEIGWLNDRKAETKSWTWKTTILIEDDVIAATVPGPNQRVVRQHYTKIHSSAAWQTHDRHSPVEILREGILTATASFIPWV